MKQRRRTRSAPPSPTHLFNQAVAQQRCGKLTQAATLYKQVLALQPNHAGAWGNLGSLLRQQGDYAAARTHLEKATQLDPHNADHQYNLANLHLANGAPQEAAAAYRKATALRPDYALAHYNLGLALAQSGARAAAIPAYRAALTADPALYDAYSNLATLLEADGLLGEADTLYRQAIELQPERPDAWNNRGLNLKNAGQFSEALHCLHKALQYGGGLHKIASNILMTLQYLPDIDDTTLLQAARDFGRRFPVPAPLHRPSVSGRPLRVGLVSADLYNHPVGLFLRNVLPALDPARISLFCYSNGTLTDEVSALLAASCQWRNIAGADDEAVLAQIRGDAVDVLVDLSGHTSDNRLPLFANRSAPLQVSWLGYFATTGLPAMDAVIMDPYHVPPGSEGLFTEQVVRMPHTRFCYSPAPFAPEVMPPPCLNNGYVTFGSFNNTAKLNQQVLDLWGKILQQAPGSRLVLKWRTFVDGSFCQRVLDHFASYGIAADRIELRGQSVHRELLAQYADIDIALDPFPFTGGHTSCEALWMGVPVLTLPGSRPVSRQTLCFLANIGLDGLLAAGSEADYLQKAVALAGNPELLASLRRELRGRMQASPLLDAAGFARDFEGLLFALWENAPAEEPTAEALHTAAIEQWQCGDAAGARELLLAAIRQAPAVAVYHANLGVVLKSLDLLEERIICYQKAVELAPDNPVYHANLAAALNEQEKHGAAEAAARQALVFDPRRPESWHNLGSALAGQERWAEAAEAYDAALQQRPGWLTALHAAAQAWQKAGRFGLAVEHYQHLLGINPAAGPTEQLPTGPLLHSLGSALSAMGKHADAEACYREALGHLPDDMALVTDLGNALKAQGKFDAAVQCYRRVVAEAPQLAGGHGNLGTIHQALGQYTDAIDCFREALRLSPQLVPIWGNLGNCLCYSPDHGPQDVLAVYQAFDEVIARPLYDSRPFLNEPHTGRRLRIGYVSPDFRRHAVAYFALPLLEGHHTDQFEVFCYYNHRQRDGWTERFKATAAHWRDCANLDDAALARQIRADEIDILVDLAGHTENNRLLTFARKPAPVQVTWMGYVTTTGMSAMDWRVTHADADPPGTETDYSEQLWRLPGAMWCYRPLPDMPEVAPPPFLRKGYVTFGSFNRYSKNSALVLRAWAQIMRRVEDSRLLICVPEGTIREEMFALFEGHGVARKRIDCFSKLSHAGFWDVHAEVDIALDPFPFGGGTTTCETLWLGVPLITCTGLENGDFTPRFASRMGFAFLNSLGLPELATNTVADYITRAVELAGHGERLEALRYSLRPRMAAAPLTNEKRFAQEMEAAYCGMWQKWVTDARKMW